MDSLLLIIEDQPDVSRILKRTLESASPPFDVFIAPTLALGIVCARREMPAAVILDLYLPDSHGLSTLTRFLDEIPGATVIVLTGIGNGFGAEARAAGAAAFVTKPVSPAHLPDQIRDAIASGDRIHKLKQHYDQLGAGQATIKEGLESVKKTIEEMKPTLTQAKP